MILTPKEKAAKKAKQAKFAKEANDKLKAMFDAVAATEDGRNLFKYFMELLGFHKNTVTMNPTTGEINKEISVYLEARRSVYLDMRTNISDRYLKKIEFK